MSEDELSNVSGGWREVDMGCCGIRRYATTEEEKEWEKELLPLEREQRKDPFFSGGCVKANEYLDSHPCPSGFRGGRF